MKIKEIVSALERFTPLPLRDGFGNTGLQIGLIDTETTGALLCLDVTEAVLGEAIAPGCDLVISHHPLVFRGYKSITGKGYVERYILRTIKNDIVIYLAHTNLDNAPGGMNYEITEKIGLKSVRILEPKENCLIKLVTLIPTAQAGEVRNALFIAGCGYMDDYDSCSYNTEGEGTFRAQEGSKPFCGNIGKLHHETEVRVETTLPEYKRREIIRTLLLTHPYEEPAYDLYPLYDSWIQAGAGITEELEEAEPELELLKRIKKTSEAGCLKHNELAGRPIQRVTPCGEAGVFPIPQAIGSGVDVFITGEIKYHDYFGRETDILLAEIGYYGSGQYTREVFYSII